MDETKPIFASATVWSGVATIAATLANALGYHVSDTDIATTINDLSLIVTALSGLATIYFRLKATKTLTLTNGAKQ